MATKDTKRLVEELNKMLGEAGTLHLASDDRFKVEYLPFDLLPFDVLFDGGIPRGRFVLLKGPYSTLKSYICLQAVAATQRRGGTCAYFDTEKSFDPEWAASIGVDVNNLILQQPEVGEAAVDAAEVLTRNGIDLIVFDSIAATAPQAETSKRLYKEQIQPGRQAALMSAACRRLTAANTGRTAFIWTNQLRESIGVVFGPTEKGPGGRAMGFYASVIVDIRKTGRHMRTEKVFTGDKTTDARVEYAQTFKATVEKSKLNQPFKETYFNFRLEEPAGIDLPMFYLTQGVASGLVTRRGNTWTYKRWSAVGKEKFLHKLTNDKEMQTDIDAELRKFHGLLAKEVLSPHRGRPVHRSKKAAASSVKSSKSEAAVSTRTRARAVSSATAARKTNSSKSSSPTVRTLSKRKTS